MRSNPKENKGKTWPPVPTILNNKTKRKKPSGLVNQGTKRPKTLPLCDRKNHPNFPFGNKNLQKKKEQSLQLLDLVDGRLDFYISSTSADHNPNILLADETLDSIDSAQSSQEQEYVSNSDERPSTEMEPNIPDPPGSNCVSMDTSYSDDENSVMDDQNVKQDKPLASFPKVSQSSPSNMKLVIENSLPKTSTKKAFNLSEMICFIELLPEEILVAIFRYLPFLSRERSSIVCKLWYKISLKNSLLEIFPTDIYGMMVLNMRKHRKHLRNYLEMRLQNDINADMRSVLVDWLIEVAEEFRIQSETLFLCIRCIDQYLSRIDSTVTRNRFQLLGVTSLFIAAYP